jgi:hypothetical protein
MGSSHVTFTDESLKKDLLKKLATINIKLYEKEILGTLFVDEVQESQRNILQG